MPRSCINIVFPTSSLPAAILYLPTKKMPRTSGNTPVHSLLMLAGRLVQKLNAVESPKPKGRVERMFETLQSRLPVELRLAGITDIDAANESLTFILVNSMPNSLYHSIKGYTIISNHHLFCEFLL